MWVYCVFAFYLLFVAFCFHFAYAYTHTHTYSVSVFVCVSVSASHSPFNLWRFLIYCKRHARGPQRRSLRVILPCAPLYYQRPIRCQSIFPLNASNKCKSRKQSFPQFPVSLYVYLCAHMYVSVSQSVSQSNSPLVSQASRHCCLHLHLSIFNDCIKVSLLKELRYLGLIAKKAKANELSSKTGAKREKEREWERGIIMLSYNINF